MTARGGVTRSVARPVTTIRVPDVFNGRVCACFVRCGTAGLTDRLADRSLTVRISTGSLLVTVVSVLVRVSAPLFAGEIFGSRRSSARPVASASATTTVAAIAFLRRRGGVDRSMSMVVSARPAGASRIASIACSNAR